MSVTAKSSAEHDYLARYLHQVWQAPLLSREEEVALAQEMKLGGRAGQRARDKLVTAHQKLAAKVARKFATNHRREMEDLLQEANIGLLVAVDKFEVERGFRFSTMAFHWVRQQVSDYCANNTPQVRIPVTRMRKIRKLRETILKLEAAGQAVTDTALAAEMQCSVAEVRDLSDDLLHQVSLNAPIGDSGCRGRADFGAAA
jgi:RNA polymerase primary sigma factor